MREFGWWAFAVRRAGLRVERLVVAQQAAAQVLAGPLAVQALAVVPVWVARQAVQVVQQAVQVVRQAGSRFAQEVAAAAEPG